MKLAITLALLLAPVPAAPAASADEQLARTIIASHFANAETAKVSFAWHVPLGDGTTVYAGTAEGEDRDRSIEDRRVPTGPRRFLLTLPSGDLKIEDAADTSLNAEPIASGECRAKRESGDRMVALAVCRMAQQQAQAAYRKATFQGFWLIHCAATGRPREQC